jgi:hypothetical protein
VERAGRAVLHSRVTEPASMRVSYGIERMRGPEEWMSAIMRGMSW